MSVPSDQPTTELSDLQQELFLHICDYLPWPSLVAFRLSSQRMEQLLSPQRMIKHHSRCCAEALDQEREMSQGLVISDQDWPTWNLESAHPSLPCYNCLEWKTSATLGLQGSAFTRAMSVGKYDLGMSSVAKRFCIDCGISKGYYTRGCRIGYHFLCRLCNKRASRAAWNIAAAGRDPNLDWKGVRYCQDCIEQGGPGLPTTYPAWLHNERWEKYEKAMQARAIYRRQNANRLRTQLGLPPIATEDEMDADGKKGWRYCALREKFGLCDCQKRP